MATTMDRRMSSANEGLSMPSSLLIRRLPINTTTELAKAMLVFAKDLQDVEVVPVDREEDKGFVSAIARFSSTVSAAEAQTMLDGKKIPSSNVNMIVELLSTSFNGSIRRNTIDPTAARTQITSATNRPIRASVRDRFSPPLVSPESVLESSNSISGLLTSPRNNLQMSTRSGKDVISEDGEDETDDIVDDPRAAFLQQVNGGRYESISHQQARLSTAAFNNLTANPHGFNSPSPVSFNSPRNAGHPYYPGQPFSPTYQNPAGGPPLRHIYPPNNPADQNPPCNTLYVGNLPMDTSEDELKAMFSKQAGYKRLCFRTKQNGPMCFVEFEDITFATRALNDLYGAQLHNSVKGGVRLSFSKNPLGVRSGQLGGSTPNSPLGSPGGFMSGMPSPGGYGMAGVPPPGLSAPSPYANVPNSNAFSPAFANSGLGLKGFGNSRSSAVQSPNNGNGTVYPDYMLGR